MRTTRITVGALLALLVAAPSASAALTASQNNLVFPPTFYGMSAPSQTVTVTNTGGKTLNVHGGGGGQSGGTSFSFGRIPENTMIPPGGSVPVVVGFTPDLGDDQITTTRTGIGEYGGFEEESPLNVYGLVLEARGKAVSKNDGLKINGTPGNDILRGTAGPDVINCGAGNDRVRAGGGNDVINCGSGRDTVSGGSGKDKVNGGGGSDRLSGNTGNDKISGGGGNDRLSGDRGNDRLSGGSGRDRIRGGDGNDRLSGGGGRDRLSGGRGRDREKQ